MSDVLYPLREGATADSVVSSTRRWLERAVIGLNLCPFAKAVHVKQQIRFAVTAASTTEELRQELRRELELLAQANPQQVDTTLLIHPRVLSDFMEYNDFLHAADALLTNLGHEGDIQIASFHPQYQFADSEPDDISNFTNRSPHPMLHLLREASIERAVATFPDPGEIYERNIDTLRRLGHGGWQRLWRSDQG